MSDNKIFDRERMEKALSGNINTVPEGLSREEVRDFIENVALQGELALIDDTYLDLLDNGIDKYTKLIPDEVWERVKGIREKAKLAQNNNSML